MSIAQSLIEGVLQAASEAKAQRVGIVEIDVGAMKLVVPEAMQAAWEAVRENTLANDAELKINEILTVAQCRACGHRYEPDITYSFLCPECGQADVEIVQGGEILLKSVTCQVEDESS